MIEAAIPRVKCAGHGVIQVPASWSEKNSRFTMEFESAVILCLQEDSIKAVAGNFSLSWDEANGIMARAVKRGMQRRQMSKPEQIGIDKTSFQKRHEYVTVILDKQRNVVIDILEDRKAATLTEWFKHQQLCDFKHINGYVGSVHKGDTFIIR